MCINQIYVEQGHVQNCRDKTVSSATSHKVIPKENIEFIVVLEKQNKYLDLGVMISLAIEFIFPLRGEK